MSKIISSVNKSLKGVKRVKGYLIDPHIMTEELSPENILEQQRLMTIKAKRWYKKLGKRDRKTYKKYCDGMNITVKEGSLEYILGIYHVRLTYNL